MKDKAARALAIVALVFMGIFVAALVATLVDHTLLGGSIGFIALGSGVFALMIFVALKADGRGYSISRMNNEIEMQKLENARDGEAGPERTDAPQNVDAAESPETAHADGETPPDTSEAHGD